MIICELKAKQLCRQTKLRHKIETGRDVIPKQKKKFAALHGSEQINSSLINVQWSHFAFLFFW